MASQDTKEKEEAEGGGKDTLAKPLHCSLPETGIWAHKVTEYKRSFATKRWRVSGNTGCSNSLSSCQSWEFIWAILDGQGTLEHGRYWSGRAASHFAFRRVGA
jgi:hypothetical protein